MLRRTTSRVTIVLVGLLAVVGCTAAEHQPESGSPPAVDTTATITFCVHFPQRDASLLFSVPDDPALAGDPAVIDQLLEIGASGLVESAPDSLRPAVDTYVAALREYEPDADPLADPSTASAVEQINGWLRANCAPPPDTSP